MFERLFEIIFPYLERDTSISFFHTSSEYYKKKFLIFFTKTTTKRHYLNDEKSSWVDEFMLPYYLTPYKEEMRHLWDLHPEEKGTVKIMGKLIQTPRWQQSYGKSYFFSGLKHEHLEIPDIIEPYLKYANTTIYAKYTKPFNMALMNWYETGHNYIGPHSDDETQLVKGKNGETIVFSISLGESRLFKLHPKDETGKKLSITMKHGMVLVMGGKCQKTHKHSVPKVTGEKANQMRERINITFRSFV
jgi:alkylated DNA repair dioxygenase AlkB